MGQTRIELSGTVLKPPALAMTPNGRAVLRIVVDCGEEPAHLVLDVVMVDGAARDLARLISAGQRIRATGTLKALRRGIGRQQIEVVASEIVTEQFVASPHGKPIQSAS